MQVIGQRTFENISNSKHYDRVEYATSVINQHLFEIARGMAPLDNVIVVRVNADLATGDHVTLYNQLTMAGFSDVEIEMEAEDQAIVRFGWRANTIMR